MVTHFGEPLAVGVSIILQLSLLNVLPPGVWPCALRVVSMRWFLRAAREQYVTGCWFEAQPDDLTSKDSFLAVEDLSEHITGT